MTEQRTSAANISGSARRLSRRSQDSHLVRSLRTFFRNRTAVFGAVILTIWVAIALLTPLLSLYDPAEQNLYDRLQPLWSQGRDGRTHILGTDHLGRDILSRLLYGSRVSLLVGAASAFFSGIIGLVLGALAGYLGGRVDEAVMGVADLQMAFPSILLALVVVAILGPALINVIIVFSVTGWVPYARTLRAKILSIKETEYIMATRAVGVGHLRTMFLHILPNGIAPLIVIASFQMAKMITQEAALSFLGVGVPATIPSWGNMLADGREYLRSAWWISTLPGGCLMSVVLGINFLGDALREAIDPLMQQ